MFARIIDPAENERIDTFDPSPESYTPISLFSPALYAVEFSFTYRVMLEKTQSDIQYIAEIGICGDGDPVV